MFQLGKHDYHIKLDRRVSGPRRIRVECNCGWKSLWYVLPTSGYTLRHLDDHRDHVARAQKESWHNLGANLLTALGVLVSAVISIAIVWFVYARPL